MTIDNLFIRTFEIVSLTATKCQHSSSVCVFSINIAWNGTLQVCSFTLYCWGLA